MVHFMARFPCAKIRASSALQAETHTRILPLPQDWHTRSNNHQIAQEYPSARRLPILIGFRDAEPYIPLALSLRGYCYGSPLGDLYCRAIIHRVYFLYAHLLVAQHYTIRRCISPDNFL